MIPSRPYGQDHVVDPGSQDPGRPPSGKIPVLPAAFLFLINSSSDGNSARDPLISVTGEVVAGDRWKVAWWPITQRKVHGCRDCSTAWNIWPSMNDRTPSTNHSHTQHPQPITMDHIVPYIPEDCEAFTVGVTLCMC